METDPIVDQVSNLAHLRHDGEPWMQTFTGRKFYPLAPMPDDITIEDIAHHLSMRVRFGGATRRFYSVAQHSWQVSMVCRPEDALWGLLHDGPEAYLGDMIRPLKHSGRFDAFIAAEHRCMSAICDRYRLPYDEPESVKWADAVLLATERRDNLAPLNEEAAKKDWLHGARDAGPLSQPIYPWSQEDAKFMFLQRFMEIATVNAPFTGTPYNLEDGGW